MQIICLGATGLVGSNFVQEALRRGHKVTAISQNLPYPETKNVESITMDLSDFGKVERFFLDRFPETIVNCAAISSPVVVDKNPDLAFKINSALPEKLAMLANHMSARLIHLSTDAVFDGLNAPYKNTDMPCPTSLYGQTKLMAEKSILKYAAALSVVLRISHVCGRGLKQNRSFDEKLFIAMSSGKKVEILENEIKAFEPVSRVAELLVELCERTNISGIYHYAGLDSLSRYEAAKKICEYFGLNSDEFLSPIRLEKDVDLTLDISALADRVKTPAVNFSEILEEIKIPDSCLDWYEKKTGKKQIKRYKL